MISINKLYIIAVAMFFCLPMLAFSRETTDRFITVKFAVSFVMVALITAIWLGTRFKNDAVRKTRMYAPFLFFTAFTFISIFAAESRIYSLAQITSFLFFFLLVFVVYNSRIDAGDAVKIMFMFQLTGLIVSSYLILQFFGIDPIKWTEQKYISTLGNTNFLAGVLIQTIPVSVIISTYHHSARVKIISVFCTAVAVAALAITNCSGGIISIISFSIIFILFALFSNTQKDRRIVAVISICILIAILSISFFPVKNAVLKLINLNDDFRKECYKATIKMVLEKPFFGAGIGNFQVRFPLFRDYRKPVFNNDAKVRHCHNDYLEIMADTGVFGLTAFLFVIMFFFNRMIKQLKDLNDDFKRMAVLSSLFVVLNTLIHSLVSFNLFMPATSSLFWGFMALGLSVSTIPDFRGKEDTEMADSGLTADSDIPGGAQIVANRSRNGIHYSICLVLCIVLLFTVLTVTKHLAADFYFEKSKLISGKQPGKQHDELTEKFMERSFMLNPNNFYLSNSLALFNLRRSDFNSASRFAETALTLEPNDYRTHLLMAEANIYLKNFTTSLKHILTADSLRRNDAGVHNIFGKHYYTAGNYGNALNEFKISIRLDGKNPESRKNLGEVYGFLGLNNRALEQFQIVRTLSPKDYNNLYNLGIAYFNLDRYGDALECFLAAHRLNHSDTELPLLIERTKNAAKK